MVVVGNVQFVGRFSGGAMSAVVAPGREDISKEEQVLRVSVSLTNAYRVERVSS